MTIRARQRSGTLVGRVGELAEFDRGLERVGLSEPWFVQLVGEPGIGKTRLLAELGIRAEQRGWLVLDGRAAEFERDVPFGVIVDALNDYLGGLDRERLARRQPVALLLDDLHWADAASFELIGHLVRRFRGPLLGAFAFRRPPARPRRRGRGDSGGAGPTFG